MHRNCSLAVLLIGSALLMPGQSKAGNSKPEQQWIEESNRYTQMLLDVVIRHSPEYASSQGLAQYDAQIRSPTLADELAERAERDAVIERIKAQLPQEKERNVAEDLQILLLGALIQDVLFLLPG